MILEKHALTNEAENKSLYCLERSGLFIFEQERVVPQEAT